MAHPLSLYMFPLHAELNLPITLHTTTLTGGLLPEVVKIVGKRKEEKKKGRK